METPETGIDTQDTGTDTGGETEGGDLSPILGRFDQLNSRLDGLEQSINPPDDGYYDPYAEEADQQDQGQDPYADQGQYQDQQQYQSEEQAAQQALQDYVHSQADERIQQALAPLQQQLQDQHIDSLANDLVGEYPEINSPEVAEPLLDAALERGHAMGLTREAAMHPGFVKLVYQAEKASAAAAGETPAGGYGQQVEAGGGANPAGGGGDVDRASEIANAGGGNKPFFLR